MRACCFHELWPCAACAIFEGIYEQCVHVTVCAVCVGGRVLLQLHCVRVEVCHGGSVTARHSGEEQSSSLQFALSWLCALS